MDLERIKQNFRIRSGRSKLKKRTLPLQGPNSHLLSNGLPASKSEPSQEKEKQTATETGTAEPQVEGSKGAEQVQDPSEEKAKQDDFNLTAEPLSSEAEDFDLNPPEPRPRPPSLEDISILLFSSDHLNSLLHQPPQLTRFSAFLQRYLPQSYPLLSQYLETQKAIKAVEYANAIAEGLRPKETGQNTTTEIRKKAANLDPEFENISNASFQALVGNALPAYISYLLVKVVSECLTNELTGRNTPVMRDLVGGLSEVFCLTDPQQEDNPIIYASEEFYRLTRYGPEDTVNNNCRFLQGRKTNPDSHVRLRNAIQNGEEIYETLLNYRRDGKPFMNLLMIAPLHDKNGKLKYFLGAQIDVTGLVQGGRALDGFQRFLTKRIAQTRSDGRRSADVDQKRKSRALAKLRDLSEMFDMEETAIVQEGSRSNSLTRDDDDNRSIASLERTPRRVFADQDLSDTESDEQDTKNWEFGQASDGKLSGKLPGVYDSFMLIRAAPSLRIVFVSPKLQKIGTVLQTPFLSHVAAPAATLQGLKGSLLSGVPVSAKIHFMPERGQGRDGTQLKNGTKHEDGPNGRAVWVSLTPLLGQDDQPGVWMCVFVEKAKVGSLQRQQAFQERFEAEQPTMSVETLPNQGHRQGRQRVTISRHDSQKQPDGEDQEDRPIKPVRAHSKTNFVGVKHDEHNEAPEKKDSGRQIRGDEATQEEQHVQSLRKLESVYFDAEGGQQSNKALNHKSNTSQNPIDRTTESEHEKVVITPVEEYQPTSKGLASYSIDESPKISQAPSSSDLHRSVEPQQGHDLPRNGRVLIEEDEAILDEDTGSSREISRESSRSPSHSPVWSPPSIPSSAQVESDDELVMDTPTHPRFPAQQYHQHSSIDQMVDDATQEQDLDEPSSKQQHLSADFTSDDQTYEQHEDEPTHEVNTSQIKQTEQHHELPQGEESPDTLRPLSREHTTNKSDKDSAIGMNSPTQSRHHFPVPSISSAHTPNDHDDIEHWIREGRPLPNQQISQVGMDYIRAGDHRLNRPPNLSRETMEEANRTADLGKLTGSDDEICARSPYSVD